MPPSPEKAEAPEKTTTSEKQDALKAAAPNKVAGPPGAEQAVGAGVSPTGRGLQLEARVTAPTWEIGLAAVMLDFTPGEVILLLDDQIAAGTRVTIQVNTSSFVGDILYCSPIGSRWEAHVSFDDVDATGLRRTPRFPVRIPARAFANSGEGPQDGTIIDISGEGLGIELPAKVPMHANIAIQSEENTALGVVRHCRELSSGRFRVGVQLHHILRKDLDLEKASAQAGWMNKLGARLGRKKPDRPKGWS